MASSQEKKEYFLDSLKIKFAEMCYPDLLEVKAKNPSQVMKYYKEFRVVNNCFCNSVCLEKRVDELALKLDKLTSIISSDLTACEDMKKEFDKQMKIMRDEYEEFEEKLRKAMTSVEKQ